MIKTKKTSLENADPWKLIMLPKYAFITNLHQTKVIFNKLPCIRRTRFYLVNLGCTANPKQRDMNFQEPKCTFKETTYVYTQKLLVCTCNRNFWDLRPEFLVICSAKKSQTMREYCEKEM